MKILYLSSLYYPRVGGAERIAQWLAEEMAARGNHATVVTLCERGDAQISWVNGVKIRYIPIRNVYLPFVKSRARPLRLLWHLVDSFNPIAARAVGRIIDEDTPDVVHTHNVGGFSAAVWPQVRARDIPCVHSIYDYYLLCSRWSMFRHGCNCQNLCAPCALLSAPRRKAVTKLNAVVAPSRFVLDLHEKFGALANIPIKRVIYAGVPSAADEPMASRRLPGSLRVGFLGRLDPSKGIELLLEEFQQFSKDLDCRLLIGGTGAGEYVNRLKSRYETSRVIFLGLVDPDWFMDHIDLLAVPSLWNDPFPTVVLEALAKGVALVASKRGGIPEAIRNSVNSVAFEPDVPGDLSRALRAAASFLFTTPDLPRRNARSEEGHTVPAMCDQYESLYREVRHAC